MDLLQSIRKYAGQPITHQLLTSLLKDYNRPNDKIHSLIKEGYLLAIKRGIYIYQDRNYQIYPGQSHFYLQFICLGLAMFHWTQPYLIMV